MDDLISRQASIDAFDGAKVDEEYCDEYDIGYNDGINFAISKLSVLPSAQRKGKWVYLTGLDAFECSVCGSSMVRNIFTYCPWCGARMEKGENDGRSDIES